MLSYLAAFTVDFFYLSLAEMMDKSYTSDFSLLYGINGGTTNLINAFSKALNEETTEAFGALDNANLGKSTFRLSTAIDGIIENSNLNKVTLKCLNTTNDTVTYEDFDYVVCAIPFSSLRRVEITPLFSQRKMQAITELHYEPAQKSFLYLKERFWEMGNDATRIVGGSSATSLPIIELIYPSDHTLPIRDVPNGWTFRPNTSPNEPGVLLGSYNWGQSAERLGNEDASLRLSDVINQVELVHNLPKGYINDNLISSFLLSWSYVPYIWSGGCLGKPQDKILFSYAVTLPEMKEKVFLLENIFLKSIFGYRELFNQE